MDLALLLAAFLLPPRLLRSHLGGHACCSGRFALFSLRLGALVLLHESCSGCLGLRKAFLFGTLALCSFFFDALFCKIPC